MTATTTLKIGDKVRLKSGGPKMTINAIIGSGDEEVVCVWFPKDSSSLNSGERFYCSSLKEIFHKDTLDVVP